MYSSVAGCGHGVSPPNAWPPQAPLSSSPSFHQFGQAPVGNGLDYSQGYTYGASWNATAPLQGSQSFISPTQASLTGGPDAANVADRTLRSTPSFTHYGSSPLKTAPGEHHIAWARNLFLSPPPLATEEGATEPFAGAEPAVRRPDNWGNGLEMQPPGSLQAALVPKPGRPVASKALVLADDDCDEKLLSATDELEGQGTVCCSSMGCSARAPAETSSVASLAAPSQCWSLGPAFQERSGWFGAKLCGLGTPQLTDAEIERMVKLSRTPVVLQVYAVGHDKAIQYVNWMTQNFLKHGGVFHAAIEVFGKEWSYGGTEDDGTGIFCCEPRRCEMHTFRQSVFLGETPKTAREVSDILRRMTPEWMGADYDLLHKNCCYFSAAFAKELCVGDLPGWVNRFAREGATIHDDVKAGLHALHSVSTSMREGFERGLHHLTYQHQANES